VSFRRVLVALLCVTAVGSAGAAPTPFRVLAFYAAAQDPAHISFVREANRWFPDAGRAHGFTYDATSDWTRLREDVLREADVVVFLDARPERQDQRAAFQAYIENGGAWLGFHFAAFALTPSDYAQDWDWYHERFLGSGSYVSNTWRPTSAVLRVDAPDHAATRGLPRTFRTAPNEWYRWQRDLRANPDIRVLLSIDPSSFPLGTGPKPHEIWRSGDYPVAWTNARYRMAYVNWGHNDIDYDRPGTRELSSTFSEPTQNEFVLGVLRWLGTGRDLRPPVQDRAYGR
jgi:hypothetical protein